MDAWFFQSLSVFPNLLVQETTVKANIDVKKSFFIFIKITFQR